MWFEGPSGDCVLAWRIPGTAEPGGLPPMGSHRVRHNWSNLAAATGRLLLLHMHPHLCLYSPHIPPLYSLSAPFSLGSMEMLLSDCVWTLAHYIRMNQGMWSTRGLKEKGGQSLEVWSKFRVLFHFLALGTCECEVYHPSSSSRSTVKTWIADFI